MQGLIPKMGPTLNERVFGEKPVSKLTVLVNSYKRQELLYLLAAGEPHFLLPTAGAFEAAVTTLLALSIY